MLCAAILTPLVRRLSHRFGVLDHAVSSRKIHGRAVPRLGGIAIVIAFYAPLAGLLFTHSGVGYTLGQERHFALGLFLGGLPIAALGIYDDLRGAGARKKFIVQFLVAGTMYFLGFRVEEIANPFGSTIVLGWVALPFTLIWVVGVINAMNLIDGLDGLAGGVALVAVSTIFLVSFQRSQPLMILFCASLGGAILGFLFYNFNPASIFMGDTGSMFLGFVLATSSIRTNQKSSTTVAVLIPIITLGLPILDTLLAMSRRAVRGRPLFRADKEHIHHRLLGLGLTHRQAVLVLYAMCLLLGAVALMLTYTNSAVITVTLLAVLAVTLFIFLRRLGYIRFEVNHFLSDQRRRNRALRVAVRPFADRLRRVNGAEEIWDVVREVSTVFAAGAVRLELPGGELAGQRSKMVFSSAPPVVATSADELVVESTPTPSPCFRARFGLVGIRREEGQLEFGWYDARTELDRDIEIAIELFCDYLVDAYERIRSRPRVAQRESREPQLAPPLPPQN
jgi:UDP-GlcNAc:undecaprenyl-phosphate/decaprenyl-phosphate GlcNAc-1-phosphate transferase